MTTKEWAAASGACTALWQLQPHQINCTLAKNGETASALQWLTKHWGRAKSVKFDIHKGQHVRENPLKLTHQALGSRSADLSHVRQLCFTCKAPFEWNLGKFSYVHSNWRSWVLWLLEQAKSLTVLNLSVPFEVKLGASATLKHLIFDATTTKHPDFSKLGHLETAWLGGMPLRYISLVVPASLKHLRLLDLAPRPWVRIPEGCTLSIGISDGSASSPYEETSEDYVILWVDNIGTSVMPTNQAQMVPPRALSLVLKHDCAVLYGLSWHLFACLSVLIVEGKSPRVRLPALKHLAKLYISGVDHLELDFEDVESLARTVQAMSVKYTKGRVVFGPGSDVLARFEHQLELRGKGLLTHHATGMDCMVLVPERVDLAGWEAVCECHCCWDCLARAGVV